MESGSIFPKTKTDAMLIISRDNNIDKILLDIILFVPFEFSEFVMLADLFKRFGFNLSDTFSCNRKHLAHLFKSVGHAITKTEPPIKNFLFSRSKVGDYFVNIALKNFPCG